MRKMNPTSAPVVSPPAGPITTPTVTIVASVTTENTSPSGNRKAPMTLPRIWASARRRTARFVRGGEHRPRAVGPDGLGARHDLAERAHHLAVALAGLVVGGDEVALHDAEHEEQRDRDADRDERQQPVVGEHHGGDDHHQGAVDQPGQTAPPEEVGERLDVARDAGHERAAPLVVVVGEADAVDVVDQARAQVVERLLAARAEPHDGGALAHRSDRERPDGDDGAGHDEAHPHAVGVAVVVDEDALVDRLLDQDRHHHAAAGADRGEQPGDAEALAQHRAPPRGRARSRWWPSTGPSAR